MVSSKSMRALSLAALALQLLYGCCYVPAPTEAFRTGAPSLACMQMRPVHGLYRPKPASASQFLVTQSSLSYSPGSQENITVEIATHSNERHFKGFLVKAYDPMNGHHIGQFLPTEESHPIDSCSASTHRNHREKKRIALIWQPPMIKPPQAADTSIGTPGETGSLSDWMGSLRTLGNQRKRQLTNTTSTLPRAQQTAGGGGGSRQVRFRATIVVSYQEFYTEFESSEKIFEEFGYSKPTATA